MRDIAVRPLRAQDEGRITGEYGAWVPGLGVLVSAEALPEAEPRESRGLAAQAAALAAGEVTARELTERTLARIAATQPTLNAFRRVRGEAALAEADAADRRLERGERRPLLGVPLAVKDDMDVAGLPTAFGCPGDFPDKVADGEAVRRLRAAGAVIVGKTNSPELGQWPFTEGPAFGDTRNPWSLEHTPGGSSGGSAAAVAAGLVPAALGSDGAGSIRIPAAWSHLVGIKPQRGRISTLPDPEAFKGITVFGPLARTVEDAALLLDAAAGNADGDLHRPEPVDASSAVGRDPGRLRIALSLRPPWTATRKSLDPQVRTAVTALAERLAALGHEVEEADPDYGPIGLAFVPRATAGIREWSLRARTRPSGPAYPQRGAHRPSDGEDAAGAARSAEVRCSGGSGASSSASTSSSRRPPRRRPCASATSPGSPAGRPTAR